MSATLWQRIEGGLIAVGALTLAVLVADWPWWVWPLALLAPDLAMLSYLAGPRFGAFVYNVAHLYAGGLMLAVAGVISGAGVLIALGAVWLVHVGADRALGYGLKQPSGFKDTNLGRLG